MCAECQVLLLPLDVGNYRTGSNVDMKIFWYIIYMTSAFFIILILPFALFYYESDEDHTFVSNKLLYEVLIENSTLDCH